MYGVWFVMYGQSMIGVIYVFIQYKNLFVDKFIDLIQFYVWCKVLQVYMDCVVDVLQIEIEELVLDVVVWLIDGFDGVLLICVLLYMLKGGQWLILSDVMFDVLVGSKIVIVGCIGSGKMMLLNLICGFVWFVFGMLFVGGVDFVEVNLW